MNFKEILKDAIRTNTKIIITGKSGYGKSEMVKQVAEELGLELIDFRLSEILPEDLVGLPKVNADGTFYEYIPPKWVYTVNSNPEKKYLLFLDEITQGTPEVLNICYKIFDKVTKVGNYELPNVAVVGATNYSDESNYINELPTPLKNRACQLELDHTSSIYSKYLMTKYNLSKDVASLLNIIISESNPRSAEKAIQLLNAKANPQLIIPFIGQTNYETLANYLIGNTNYSNLSNLDKAKADIDNGFTKIKNKMYFIDDAYLLKLLYDLTDEEYELVKDYYQNYQPKGTLQYNLFETIFKVKDGITADDLRNSPIAFREQEFWKLSYFSKNEVPKYKELIKLGGWVSAKDYFNNNPWLKNVFDKYAPESFRREFGF